MRLFWNHAVNISAAYWQNINILIHLHALKLRENAQKIEGGTKFIICEKFYRYPAHVLEHVEMTHMDSNVIVALLTRPTEIGMLWDNTRIININDEVHTKILIWKHMRT